MTTSNLELLEFWYQASRSEVGIVVETSDPEHFRQKMYAVRRDSGDPSLMDMALIISPSTQDQVWIVRTKNEEL